MKRRSTPWSVVWAVVILLCGWRWVEGQGRLPSIPASAQAVEVGAADSGREIRLHPGQTLAIDLPPSSGLGLQCWLVDPAQDVLDVEQEPSRAVRSHSWTFRATRTGQGRLTFECHDTLTREPPGRPDYAITVE